MGKPGHTGARRLIHATRFSLRGFAEAWRHESAFRQEVVAAVFLVPAGLWLGGDHVERLILVGSCLLVLVVELLNSAVEAAIDRVGEEQHALSARAKDLGSAAVMTSLLLFALAWGMIGWERFAG